MIKMKIGDWVILLFSLFLIPMSWSMTKQQPGETTAVKITVADTSPATYSIMENHQIKVTGELGDSIIEIHDGKVRFIHSPCSGKVCILSGWHQQSGDHIACLPNKVGVSLLSQEDRFDGINF